nr:hypothetical protein Iba_chr11eCG12310 [Ipomoea batatas]
MPTGFESKADERGAPEEDTDERGQGVNSEELSRLTRNPGGGGAVTSALSARFRIRPGRGSPPPITAECFRFIVEFQ